MTENELIKAIIKDWEQSRKDLKDIFHYNHSLKLLREYTHQEVMRATVKSCEGD